MNKNAYTTIIKYFKKECRQIHPLAYSLYAKSPPDCSIGKKSACNAGNPGLIPGSGRSTGKRVGYPLQYSWASFVAHLVKNPPTVWETWV